MQFPAAIDEDDSLDIVKPPSAESPSCEVAPEAFTAEGLTFAYDESCTSDGEDCVSDHCRICKFRAVDLMYEGYVDCNSIGSDATQFAPEIPTAIDDDDDEASESVEPSSEEPSSCEAAPEAFIAQGLTFVFDDTCTSDDSSCVSDHYRICKFQAVDPLYEGYTDCSSIGSAAEPSSPMQVSVKMATTDESSESFRASTLTPFEYAVAGAVAIGVVVVVAMVVLGVTRIVNRLHSTLSVQEVET